MRKLLQVKFLFITLDTSSLKIFGFAKKYHSKKFMNIDTQILITFRTL